MTLHEQYAKAGIPKRFWGLTVDDYEAEGPTGTAAKVAVCEYIENMTDRLARGVGLTLIGPPGVGKTMLATIIAQAAVEKQYSTLYLPIARYMHWLQNLIAWRDSSDINTQMAWATLRSKVQTVKTTVKFLILDDVGKEHVTESKFAEDEFDYLLRLRYDVSRPTIMTSNVEVPKWVGNYGRAMESFIHEAAPPVVIDRQDYRKR